MRPVAPAAAVDGRGAAEWNGGAEQRENMAEGVAGVGLSFLPFPLLVFFSFSLQVHK